MVRLISRSVGWVTDWWWWWSSVLCEDEKIKIKLFSVFNLAQLQALSPLEASLHQHPSVLNWTISSEQFSRFKGSILSDLRWWRKTVVNYYSESSHDLVNI